MTDRVKLSAGVGCCLLLAGLAVLFVAAPVHTTEIERSAPSEHAMANASEHHSPDEISVIPFATLSAAEQRAVAGAIHAPDERYTDRGQSENGTSFAYRNDIIRQYFVGYEERIYLVRTWIAVEYRLLPFGVGGVLFGLPVLGFGAWRWWRGRGSDAGTSTAG